MIVDRIQRYDPERPVHMEVYADGQWICFEDHQAVVAKLQKQMEGAVAEAVEELGAKCLEIVNLRKELVDAARRNANLLRQLPEEKEDESDSRLPLDHPTGSRT